jgi:hypothetical protein
VPTDRRAAPGAGARVRRMLAASVLACEALVVVFAVLVAKDLADVPTGTIVAVGTGAALACLLLAGLLRHRWAYAAGSVLQALLVLSGLVVPAMFLVGGVFAGLWVLALYLAHRVHRLEQAGPAAS